MPVPGLKKEEKIVLFTRKHWVSFLPACLIILIAFFLPWIILLFLLFSGFELFGVPLLLIIMMMSIYYLIILEVTLILWISYYCDFLIVTHRSIIRIDQNGIFDRQITEISLLRVQEGNSEIKGVLGTLFGFGDIVIQTASEKEKAVFENFPNPYEINQKILDLHEALVHRENIDFISGMGEGEVAKEYEKKLEEGKVVEL